MSENDAILANLALEALDAHGDYDAAEKHWIERVLNDPEIFRELLSQAFEDAIKRHPRAIAIAPKIPKMRRPTPEEREASYKEIRRLVKRLEGEF